MKYANDELLSIVCIYIVNSDILFKIVLVRLKMFHQRVNFGIKMLWKTFLKIWERILVLQWVVTLYSQFLIWNLSTLDHDSNTLQCSSRSSAPVWRDLSVAVNRHAVRIVGGEKQEVLGRQWGVLLLCNLQVSKSSTWKYLNIRLRSI